MPSLAVDTQLHHHHDEENISASITPYNRLIIVVVRLRTYSWHAKSCCQWLLSLVTNREVAEFAFTTSLGINGPYHYQTSLPDVRKNGNSGNNLILDFRSCYSSIEVGFQETQETAPGSWDETHRTGNVSMISQLKYYSLPQNWCNHAQQHILFLIIELAARNPNTRFSNNSLCCWMLNVVVCVCCRNVTINVERRTSKRRFNSAGLVGWYCFGVSDRGGSVQDGFITSVDSIPSAHHRQCWVHSLFRHQMLLPLHISPLFRSQWPLQLSEVQETEISESFGWDPHLHRLH